MTFNLANGTYKLYKKSNDSLLYINTYSVTNKLLPTSINERLSQNSSSEEIFNASKYEYEKALKNSRNQQTELIFNKKEERKHKRNLSLNIILFNPPFSRNATTDVAKRFLDLLDLNFPKTNKLHKIFNRTTVKVSYCTNLSSITKGHNKRVTNEKIAPKDQRNFREKNGCPLDGNCQTSDII